MNYFNYLFKVACVTLLSSLLLTSCEETTDENLELEDQTTGLDPDSYKNSGFVITGTTLTSAFAAYFEEVPTGTVDLSQGTDFQRFWPTAIYNSQMFLPRPDGAAGFARVIVNNDGEFEVAGEIPTIDGGSFRLAVKDETIGVYQDRATPNAITVFDPSTLETLGTIDMSEGIKPMDLDNRYQRFVFRGDDVFAPIRENVDGNIYSGFYLHQANLETRSFVGDTYVEKPYSGGVLTVNNFGQGLLDDNGNLYFQDGGSIGSGNFSAIYKIPAGSNEIDTTYVFEPIKSLNPLNVFYPTMNGFKLIGGSKAIAKINLEVPQDAIDLINALPGNTFEEKIAALRQDAVTMNTISGILFSAETASWCELDLEAKTVTPIQGAPKLGANSTGSIIFEFDGDIYFPIATKTEQSYYKYTPGTATASKAFDVTGADLAGAFNIANNN
ncbi:hypothetical protein [Flammeovirga agarivorans]|uniref:DUF4374 domain-containing protein n=1 Tax=Flammeovirga agarivorans TaxID=2726742 RepID=A0A7X8XWN6_9BACT|nr:hypothetical protein [Flammeovirga agarivorans]NLR92285.1 hypothetical protein [Flammeovirga agarivorans]